jgi:hypothetical protein
VTRRNGSSSCSWTDALLHGPTFFRQWAEKVANKSERESSAQADMKGLLRLHATDSQHTTRLRSTNGSLHEATQPSADMIFAERTG